MTARKFAIALVLLLTGCPVAPLQAADVGPDAVAQTRQSLRDKGFKTDLADFDFTTTFEEQKREAILDLSMGFVRGRKPAVQMSPPVQPPWRNRLPEVDLMTSVGSDAAIVVWRRPHLECAYPEQAADAWPKLRKSMGESEAELDAKCAAILSGPIRFNLDASMGLSMLLPHLASMKQLSQALGLRAMLALHDQATMSAWTNLLAQTRLATAWKPEPLEISHSVRFGCAGIAAQTTWQALQTNTWSDGQLAQLQSEWESANYFKNLPETAAYARASAVAMCQLERAERAVLPSMNDLVREPKSTVGAYMQNQRYLHSGSYEDEKGLLLHYRDREVELQNAVKCATWIQMRQLSGVTNVSRFISTNGSRTMALLNLRALGNAAAFYAANSEGVYGAGFLGQAARAESQRRLVITAVALERFHCRHGTYPKTLAELSPELLAQPPVDFIDGKPLRYRLTAGGHFVLYSIGLDGIDDGGLVAATRRPRWAPLTDDEENGLKPPARKSADLVWPRPASATDVAAFGHEKKVAAEASAAEREDRQAAAQWQFTERRQQNAAELLDRHPPGVTNGITYKGRPLVNLLRNPSASRTNKLSLAEMLTLRPVTTGDEPETVTFEASLAFDAMTKLGQLQLFVDPADDSDSDEVCLAIQSDCKRAPNGNCLITWNTTFECAGIHALQLGLELNEPEESMGEIFGPLLAVTVSNLCQLSAACATYDLETGALVHAKLPESNGSYVLTMADTNGVHLKTMTGSTTNGIIKDRWDLVDERGVKFTNGVFNCLFDLTLPESGRRQKLRL